MLQGRIKDPDWVKDNHAHSSEGLKVFPFPDHLEEESEMWTQRSSPPLYAPIHRRRASEGMRGKGKGKNDKQMRDTEEMGGHNNEGLE